MAGYFVMTAVLAAMFTGLVLTYVPSLPTWTFGGAVDAVSRRPVLRVVLRVCLWMLMLPALTLWGGLLWVLCLWAVRVSVGLAP